MERGDTKPEKVEETEKERKGEIREDEQSDSRILDCVTYKQTDGQTDVCSRTNT